MNHICNWLNQLLYFFISAKLSQFSRIECILNMVVPASAACHFCSS